MPQLRMSRDGSARPAHWSQPVRPGDPSVIESPSAATTRRRLVGSGIGALRDQPREPLVLADDLVAVELLHDGLHVRRHMARMDGEVVGVRAQALELGMGHVNAVDTGCVATLADEIQRLGPEVESLGERLDALVDLPEHGLIQADALRSLHCQSAFRTTTKRSSRETTSPTGFSFSSWPTAVT